MMVVVVVIVRRRGKQGGVDGSIFFIPLALTASDLGRDVSPFLKGLK